MYKAKLAFFLRKDCGTILHRDVSWSCFSITLTDFYSHVQAFLKQSSSSLVLCVSHFGGYDFCVKISLKIWHCKFHLTWFWFCSWPRFLGLLVCDFLNFLKFSANFIKKHECYLLSAKIYIYVITAIFIMSAFLCYATWYFWLMLSLLNLGWTNMIRLNKISRRKSNFLLVPGNRKLCYGFISAS